MTTCPFSNPSQVFEDLADAREAPGLTWSAQMNRWVVSRHDDIVAALHDPITFSSQPTVPDMPAHVLEAFSGTVPLRGTLIGHDNPTHDRLRAAVNTFFMPRRIARFESWIESQAHVLIDEFYDEGEVDFRTRFSSPLPLKVISHIVGLDPDRSEIYFNALQFFSSPGPEKLQPLVDFHDEVMAAIEARRHRRYDDLISHVWNLRDSGEAEMTDFEMLSLFPGLMLAGHETSANLIVMALTHMLARPGSYEAAQVDDASRARAIEEALRFEAPITGMPRRVTCPVTLGGTELKVGDEVFLAYASGNRDRRYYDRPEEFDVNRAGTQQHIGFAQGIHACLGAPLARLLLKVEMRVIADRLPNLRFAKAYEEREYLPVREVRALVDAPFAWDVTEEGRAKKGKHSHLSEIRSDDGWIAAHVIGRRKVATDVVEIVIAADAGSLPDWTPGAHAEIELPNSLIRQYSLTGRITDSGHWTIAVLREDNGRGGSQFMHDELPVGAKIRIKPPRNHFPMSGEGPVLLIAGGIGITPMIPMLAAATARGRQVHLVYLGRKRSGMAYADGLNELGTQQVTLWPADEKGRFDLGGHLAELSPDTAVYCCGPERLIQSIERACDIHSLSLRVERFAPAQFDDSTNAPFEVILRSTGEVLPVAADETILAALGRRGIFVQSTCQQGTCGTCEVGVVEGDILHRDTVLTKEEHAAGDTIMVCVSRCAGGRLVLDI